MRLAAAANKVAAAEKKQGVKTVAKGSKVKTAGKGRGRGRGRGRGSTVEPEEEAKASEQEAEEPSIADDPSPKVTAKAKAKAKAQTRAPPVHAAAVTGINPGTTWVLKVPACSPIHACILTGCVVYPLLCIGGRAEEGGNSDSRRIRWKWEELQPISCQVQPCHP